MSSATDAYGNAVSGTATVSITNTGLTNVALNDIAVANGGGANSQIIYTATTDPVGLKVVLAGISNYVTLTHVDPANALATIDLASTVTKVTAGRFINRDVTVTLYDAYGNLKTSATNAVYFISTDADAVFTNVAGTEYVFAGTAVKVFGNTNFTYTTAGVQDLAVTNVYWARSDRIGGIDVEPDDANPAAMDTVASVPSAVAGTPFTITVSSATDAYGNAPTNDYYGSPRPMDVSQTGADNTGTEYDIGVYEFPPGPVGTMVLIR